MSKSKHKRRKEHAAQKRRIESHKTIKPQKQSYELIDGNWSRYIVGYCTAAKHPGYLTPGLANTHRCIQRQCGAFREGVSAD